MGNCCSTADPHATHRAPPPANAPASKAAPPKPATAAVRPAPIQKPTEHSPALQNTAVSAAVHHPVPVVVPPATTATGTHTPQPLHSVANAGAIDAARIHTPPPAPPPSLASSTASNLAKPLPHETTTTTTAAGALAVVPATTGAAATSTLKNDIKNKEDEPLAVRSDILVSKPAPAAATTTTAPALPAAVATTLPAKQSHITVLKGHCAFAEDGETIVLDDERRIRLLGVCAPSVKNQDDGAEEAQAMLCRLCAGKDVALECDNRNTNNRHGTIFARVFVQDHGDRVCLNDALLAAGLVTFVQPYDAVIEDRAHLIALQTEARNKRLGLWKDFTDVPVFATRNGNQFHTNECTYVQRFHNVEQRSKQECLDEGLNACKVCKP